MAESSSPTGDHPNYVMVPVPEEYAAEVQQFLRWRPARGSGIAREHKDAVADVYRDADEPSRELLVYVAQATVNDEEVTVAELAAALGLDPRETLGTAMELNHASAAVAGPPLAVTRRVASPGPDAARWERSTVVMLEGVARAVLATHRAGSLPSPPPER